MECKRRQSRINGFGCSASKLDRPSVWLQIVSMVVVKQWNEGSSFNFFVSEWVNLYRVGWWPLFPYQIMLCSFPIAHKRGLSGLQRKISKLEYAAYLHTSSIVGRNEFGVLAVYSIQIKMVPLHSTTNAQSRTLVASLPQHSICLGFYYSCKWAFLRIVACIVSMEEFIFTLRKTRIIVSTIRRRYYKQGK